MKKILHTICSILLGLFFIYKGIDKMPIKLKDVSQEEVISTIIEKQSYEAPVGYKITMNTMRQSGFLKMIAFDHMPIHQHFLQTEVLEVIL